MAIEYHLCFAEDAEELNKEVNQLLADGWELYGNPFFGTPRDTSLRAGDTPTRKLYQALIKKPK